MYVASVSDICCKCFHLDVAKIDQDIIHVAIGPTCYKIPIAATRASPVVHCVGARAGD